MSGAGIDLLQGFIWKSLGKIFSCNSDAEWFPHVLNFNGKNEGL